MIRGLLIDWAGLFLAVCVHEAGHALIGYGLGFRIEEISCGVGPSLWRWRWKGTRIEVGALPFAGYVQTSTFSGHRRGAIALFLLGGVIGNAVLFAGLAVASSYHLLQNSILRPIGMTQAYCIVINLIPFGGRWFGFPVDSDGLQLLRLVFPSRPNRERI
jgi:Peptidase family M50